MSESAKKRVISQNLTFCSFFHLLHEVPTESQDIATFSHLPHIPNTCCFKQQVIPTVTVTVYRIQSKKLCKHFRMRFFLGIIEGCPDFFPQGEHEHNNSWSDFRRKFNRICGTPKLAMLAVSGFPPILGWNVCDQIMDPIAAPVAVFLRWLACVCPHSLPVELRISLCEPGALPRLKKGPIKMQKKTITTGDQQGSKGFQKI